MSSSTQIYNCHFSHNLYVFRRADLRRTDNKSTKISWNFCESNESFTFLSVQPRPSSGLKSTLIGRNKEISGGLAMALARKFGDNANFTDSPAQISGRHFQPHSVHHRGKLQCLLSWPPRRENQARVSQRRWFAVSLSTKTISLMFKL